MNAKLGEHHTSDKCQCFDPSASQAWTERAGIGTTEQHWEVSRMRCERCGKPWVSALLEHEAFSKSGRHYRAPTTDHALDGITAEKALDLIKHANFRILGGSRFGQSQVSPGPGELYAGL